MNINSCHIVPVSFSDHSLVFIKKVFLSREHPGDLAGLLQNRDFQGEV